MREGTLPGWLQQHRQCREGGRGKGGRGKGRKKLMKRKQRGAEKAGGHAETEKARRRRKEGTAGCWQRALVHGLLLKRGHSAENRGTSVNDVLQTSPHTQTRRNELCARGWACGWSGCAASLLMLINKRHQPDCCATGRKSSEQECAYTHTAATPTTYSHTRLVLRPSALPCPAAAVLLLPTHTPRNTPAKCEKTKTRREKKTIPALLQRGGV